MNKIKIAACLTISMLICLNCMAKGDFSLQIHLPHEITIENNDVTLGQVSIIKGDEKIAAQVSRVAVGHFSSPGQEIILDKGTILSRLACSGIDTSEINFTGAEKVIIKQNYQIIKGAEFVENALNFLKQNPPEESVCQAEPLRIPEDLILPGIFKNIKLVPSFAASGAKNQAKIQIIVLCDDKETGIREISFRLKYSGRKIVARMEIPQGGTITEDNVKLENIISESPESAGLAIPYGYVAKSKIAAGNVINKNMISAAKQAAILERNQSVVIKVNRAGLWVSAIGKALQEGKVGEYIKVQNVDSQKIIMAKVNHDGSVEPVF